jgi:hypothetical protein
LGAVTCKAHGTHPGPLCCHHVREAVESAAALIPFQVYGADIYGDGTELLEHILCTACASSLGLSSANEMIPEDVWGKPDRFPDVSPVCQRCFAEWSA